MFAIVAPGQGAQTPGFLSPWLELPHVSEGLDALSAVVGSDLRAYGTTADADTIKDTAVAQPLLVAAGVLVARELLGSDEARPDLVAGHSVGEIGAAVIAGALNVDDAMVFVRERGRGMANAAKLTATSMTAIIGGDPEEVLAAIAACGLTAANYNGKGQIVAAGTVEQLAAFAEQPPRRTRLFPLSVAGAFHTHHMAPAVEQLTELAATFCPTTPQALLLSNADGAVVADGATYLERLVAQVSLPVRWDLCLDTMAAQGVTGIVELAPAGTLTGIAKRNLDGVELFALNTPDELAEARSFMASHKK
ncbi:MAG: ACP S-malonyltransferase [Propionibacteriaceae bacterium]